MKTLPIIMAAALFCAPAFADNHMPAQPVVYGQSYSIVVSDPAAAVAAMQKFRASPTGRQQPSTVNLSQNIANGTQEATHTINVFYASAEDMDASMRAAAGSADSAEFAEAFSKVATLESESVFTMQISKVNQEGIENPASMLFGLNVTDQAAFMKALNKLLDSKAAAAFPGNLFFGSIVAIGNNPTTHWVTFQAGSVGALLAGVDAFMKSADFAEYAKGADDFREVTARSISRLVLTLPPATAAE